MCPPVSAPHHCGHFRYDCVRVVSAPLLLITKNSHMPICHDHNLSRPLAKQLPYGIRVKLRSTDPFKNLVGADWRKEHWFATRDERDRALKEMSGRYVYFRPGDQPTLEYEKVDR